MTLDYGVDFFNDTFAKADSYRSMRQQEINRAYDDTLIWYLNQQQSLQSKQKASIVGYRSDGSPIYKD